MMPSHRCHLRLFQPKDFFPVSQKPPTPCEEQQQRLWPMPQGPATRILARQASKTGWRPQKLPQLLHLKFSRETPLVQQYPTELKGVATPHAASRHLPHPVSSQFFCLMARLTTPVRPRHPISSQDACLARACILRANALYLLHVSCAWGAMVATSPPDVQYWPPTSTACTVQQQSNGS